MRQESIETKKAERKRSAVMGVAFFVLVQLACGICVGALCFIPAVPGWFPVL